MKQNYKLIRLLPLFLALLCFERAAAQTYINVANTGNSGTASWGVGTSANRFDVTGPYTATGVAADHFYDATGSGTPIEISGNTAPSFSNLFFENGATSTANITNIAGVIVNTSAAFNNGITSTVRTNRAAGLLGAIQFLGSATYTPTLTPATGPDARFVDGYVSKSLVSPASFVFPVGNVTDLRPITASGTGTFATSWNSSNVASFYTGALPTGVSAISTNGFWEWATSAPSTVTVSIPNQSAFVTAASNLTIVGFNGTAWTKLGGTFSSLTENSTNTSTVSVPANITAIALGALSVPLSLTVLLQGPSTGSNMSNNLQLGGLLPSLNPYGLSTSYANINNASGVAGAVVDWVMVELRVSPYTSVAQSQALLLKTDGSIVDVNGAVPIFTSQTGNVRVVIKHRNHLAIMSTDISGFNVATSYDFTTGIAKASNNGFDSPQMVQINTKFCMWAGDVVSPQDRLVDNIDFSQVESNYQNLNTGYLVNDLNMDGAEDNLDFSIIEALYQFLLNSTLTNY